MKKQITLFVITIAIVFFLGFYKLDAYIMKPGSAYDVSRFVKVQNGDSDDVGTLSLMTVAMAPATPITYVFSFFNEYQEIMQLHEVRQEEENEEEYNVRQLKLMTDSQFNAIYVAFQKAGLPFDIEYNGVTVINVLSGGAADGSLKPGDEIVEVDGNIINRAEDLTEILSSKNENEEIKVVVDRNDELIDYTISLKEIPNSEEKRAGIGIMYSESKFIKTEPTVKINATDIGGPSAGLMFTLEILNQLLDEDLSKGYNIAGTGEMHEDGTVGRIGGIEKKVVAANEDGIEIFFAPDDKITAEMKQYNPGIVSNYEAAVKTAKNINSKMKIIPVKTIDDALKYIEELEPKREKSHQ